MARAIVLVSPAAGRGGNLALRDRMVQTISAALRERGFTPDFPDAASAEEAVNLLRTAETNGYELAVMCGGDGSVRLGVNALAGGSIALAIVPLGTGNLLAATLGLPREPIAAARRIATAGVITIDTGLLQADTMREHFAVAAGAGFDARVMSGTSAVAKARFGVLAYFATTLRLVASLPVAQAQIVVDGRTYELPTVAVLVANCGQIVPGLLGPRVTLDPSDGVLDVIAIRGGPWLTKVPVAARSALHSLLRNDAELGGHSLRLRGSQIDVKTEPAEPIELDGDLLDVSTGSFRARVRPQSLTVLV
jgi:diacylglycerol kinase family enzyme